MDIVVIGGGITGRLVQFVRPEAKVFDWGPPPQKLTRQWGANYLWEPLEGLPCREFQVVTHVDGSAPTIESVARYKEKIGKAYEQPADLMRSQFREQMPGYDLLDIPGADTIHYQMRAVEINLEKQRVVWSNGTITPYGMLVSTIPLYALRTLCKMESSLPDTLFKFDPIYVKVTPRPPDAVFPSEILYVNYLSSPAVEPYRYCDRFGERHFEALTNMGSLPTKRLVPGKIHPMNEVTRAAAISWFRQHHVYCYGRYATWDPNELVHQTYRNIRRDLEGM